MIIKIKHDQGSDQVTLPDNWRQVTWKQMSEMRKGTNYCEVFTGIALSDWNNKGATKAYMRLNNLLSWVTSAPDWDRTDFKMILRTYEDKNGNEISKKQWEESGSDNSMATENNEIDFKNVKLQTESIGQYLDVEERIRQFNIKKRKDEDLVKLYPVIIAIYADKIINGEYDYKRAMKLIDEIKAQAYQKVNNIGSFFLTNMMTLTGGGNQLWLLLTYLKRRFLRGFPLLTISTKA